MISSDEKRRITAAQKIGIITAAWGRPAISRHVLEYYTRQHVKNTEFIRVVAVSPEDDDPLGPVDGWLSVEIENFPLSNKFNLAAEYAFKLGATGIIIVGSDNILSLEYLSLLTDQARRRCEYVHPHELCVYTPGSLRVEVCLSFTSGAGRYLSLALIDRMGGQPWSDGINTHLDQNLAVRLRGLEIKSHAVRSMLEQRYVIMDIKTDDNMWELRESDDPMRKAIYSKTGEMLYIRRVISFPADRFIPSYFPEFDYESL